MNTVFVERVGGAIKGVYANRQEGSAEEELPDDHPDVVAFRVPPWSRGKLLKIVRAGREIALNRLAGIAFAAKEVNDSATVTACLAARTDLLNITTLPSVLAATDDARLTAAVGAAYAGIVASAPPSIVNAFAGIQS